jgi:hypothetical protein
MFPQITKSERIIAFDLSEHHSAVLLGDVVSAGVIQYHFVLMVVNKVGGPALYVASEWSTWHADRKLIPVLGAFFKGDHANINDDPGLIDEHIFILKAVETARDYLGLKFVEPCIGELWGIAGVMNKIGERRRKLDPPAPLPEVKYFLPFFGFIDEIKEYVASQKPTDETENLRQMIVDCNARFISVAASEGAPKRPALRLVHRAKTLNSFESASQYAKQMAVRHRTAFSVEASHGKWLVCDRNDEYQGNSQATTESTNLEPAWVSSGDFWIGRHAAIGLVVVTNHPTTYSAVPQYYRHVEGHIDAYILDQDRMTSFDTAIFISGMSGISISEYEIEIALLGYGTYLYLQQRQLLSFAPRSTPFDIEFDVSDSDTPSGLDPPEEWDLSDGWNEYGGLERSDNR